MTYIHLDVSYMKHYIFIANYFLIGQGARKYLRIFITATMEHRTETTINTTLSALNRNVRFVHLGFFVAP